jgi:hypothetical protein
MHSSGSVNLCDFPCSSDSPMQIHRSSALCKLVHKCTEEDTPYGPETSVLMTAHIHEGHHQGYAKSRCTPVRQDRLQAHQQDNLLTVPSQLMSMIENPIHSCNQVVVKSMLSVAVMRLPLGCHISEVKRQVGGDWG